MSIFYTGDWHSVGSDDYYRKVELYSMSWSPGVDVDNYCVVGASFGGPLAIIRDDKKFLKVTQNVPVKPIINLYTSSGANISSIKVFFKEKQLKMFISLILLNCYQFNDSGTLEHWFEWGGHLLKTCSVFKKMEMY